MSAPVYMCFAENQHVVARRREGVLETSPSRIAPGPMRGGVVAPSARPLARRPYMYGCTCAGNTVALVGSSARPSCESLIRKRI